MRIYMFKHIDSPYGEHVDLLWTLASSIEEAKEQFEIGQLKELKENNGWPQGQLKALCRSETKYINITFLEVTALEEYNYEDFKNKTIDNLRNEIALEKEKHKVDKPVDKHKPKVETPITGGTLASPANVDKPMEMNKPSIWAWIKKLFGK